MFVQFKIILTQNWKTNNTNRKPQPEKFKYKIEVKILANPELA